MAHDSDLSQTLFWVFCIFNFILILEMQILLFIYHFIFHFQIFPLSKWLWPFFTWFNKTQGFVKLPTEFTFGTAVRPGEKFSLVKQIKLSGQKLPHSAQLGGSTLLYLSGSNLEDELQIVQLWPKLQSSGQVLAQSGTLKCLSTPPQPTTTHHHT